MYFGNYRGRLVQIPYSPRGDGNSYSPFESVKSCRSDTLFPERGRKLEKLNVVTYIQVQFRYLIPREGTETRINQNKKVGIKVQIPYSPRGDGNQRSKRLIGPRLGSDTLFPERGRKPSCGMSIKQINSSFRYLIPREGTETGSKVLNTSL